MKNRRWKRKIIGTAAFLALAGCLLQPFTVVKAGMEVQAATNTQSFKNVTKKVTKKNPDITMEVSCGIDGVAVYDTPMLIQVTVTSSRDFNGYVQVTPAGNGYGEKVTAYAEDISLAAGAAKTFSFVSTYVGNDGKFSVALVNERDKVIYSETDTVALEGMGSVVYMGVLSDDFSALTYFDALGVNYAGDEQQINMLELTAENLPEDGSALGMLSYVLLDNYDTAKLSDKQYLALKEWVNQGGVLLVSLGANYQNVLHCFKDEFLSGTIGTVQKKNLSWDLGELIFDGNAASIEGNGNDTGQNDMDDTGFDTMQPDEEQESTMPEETQKSEEVLPNGPNSGVVRLDGVDTVEFSLEGGEEIADFTDAGTISKKNCGFGAVMVLSYDLGMEPFVSFDGRRAVALKLLQAAADTQTVSGMNGNSNAYYYNSNDIAKTMNRSKKPSILLFDLVLIIYLIVVGPVLYLILKKKNKRERIWIAIPVAAGICTVVIFLISTMYRIRKPLLNSFVIMQLGDGIVEETILTNVVCPKAKDYSLNLEEGYEKVRPQENYEYNFFDSANKDEDDNYYDLLIKKQNDGTQLRIHNSAAFQEKNFTISRISGNEVGELTLDLHFYTTGFGGTVTNNTNCNLENVVLNFENHFYMIDSLKKGESAAIDEDKLFLVRDYDSFADVMNYGNIIFSSLADRETYRKYQINQYMENYYVKKGSDRYRNGCVWASIGSYTPDMVKEGRVKQYGGAVVYFPFTGNYEDVYTGYCPDINALAIASDGDYDTTEGYMYGSLLTMTYSFDECPEITTLTYMSEEKPPSGYGKYAAVYAYNPESGAYEPIFEDSKTLSGSELQKYLVGNILVLRYQGDTSDAVYVPQISARGDE